MFCQNYYSAVVGVFVAVFTCCYCSSDEPFS